jgi:hypothetical protein
MSSVERTIRRAIVREHNGKMALPCKARYGQAHERSPYRANGFPRKKAK